MDFGVGQFEGNGQGNDAATSADVEDPGSRVPLGDLQGDFDKLLGFGAGDQGALVARESTSVEFGGTEDVLEWFAGPSAFNRVAQRDAFGLGQGAVELEVEFHAFEAEGVREQVLGIEARVFHAAVGEVALAGAENLEEREGVRHGQGQQAAGTSGPWLKKLFSEWRPDQPFGPCSEIFARRFTRGRLRRGGLPCRVVEGRQPFRRGRRRSRGRDCKA